VVFRGRNIRRSSTLGAAIAALLLLGLAAPAFGFGFLTWWGGGGSGPGDLGPHIEGVAVAPSGDVYVADQHSGLVKKYTNSGGFLRSWSVADLEGVAVAPSGDVYVSTSARVERFSAEGDLLGSWGGRGAGDGRFSGIGGVAVGPDGAVYATDSGGDRVEKFSATGALLGSFGGSARLSGPRGIAVAADGTVYVSDHDNARVVHFSASGDTLGSWPVADPHGIAVAPDGTVYVAAPHGDRVLRFGADGTPKGDFGSTGSGGQLLNVPEAVAVDCRGSVYAADNTNKRIHEFGEPGPPPPCPAPPPPPQAAPAPPPPPPPLAPTLGLTAIATPVSGTVTITSPSGGGARSAARLTTATLIPIGSAIDTTNGRVRLTFATAPGDQPRLGATESGEFYGGVFTIFQSRVATLADLRLTGSPLDCGPAGGGARVAATKKKRKKKHYVWGDAHGAYRTTGTYGAATVRGTNWLTEDRCDGTLVNVARGVVDVRDFTLKRTVRVPAGSSYLARAQCVSRRSFVIRLRPPAGSVVRDVAVYVGGRRVRVRRGTRLTAPVDLRGLPKGTVTVKITVVTLGGRTITGVRRYLTCAGRQPSHGVPEL
jgi:sugar lactone lactonase YvrE